jgi:hypothetical protein
MWWRQTVSIQPTGKPECRFRWEATFGDPNVFLHPPEQHRGDPAAVSSALPTASC